MKLRQKRLNPAFPIVQWGLSENEQHYCLVKNENKKFTVFWQQKPFVLLRFLQKASPDYTKNRAETILIRPVAHSFIWRKTVFLPKTLNDVQLHRKIIHILKQEQPLALELLNFDYRLFPNSHHNLNKIAIYALCKDYAEKFNLTPCILDCELHCYLRAIAHLKKQKLGEQPTFRFQQKIVQFTETELKFLPSEPENCIHLEDMEIPEANLYSTEQKHLYLLALGAALWNGKA